MTRHLHLTPPGRVETHALAHVLRESGLDVRLGLAHSTRPDDECAGVVLLAVDDAALGSDVAGVREQLGATPLLVVGRDELVDRATDVGASTVITWQDTTENLVATVTDFANGVIEVQETARSRTVATGAVEDSSLTRRELQIAGLLASGWRNEEIAHELGISTHTVRTHVSRVLGKLGVQHRVALAVKLRHDARVPVPRRVVRRHKQDSPT